MRVVVLREFACEKAVGNQAGIEENRYLVAAVRERGSSSEWRGQDPVFERRPKMATGPWAKPQAKEPRRFPGTSIIGSTVNPPTRPPMQSKMVNST